MGMYKSLAKALENPSDCTVLKATIKGDAFPPEIFAFPNLLELYLEAPDMKEFPESIPDWAKLRTFSVRAPSFKGSLAPLFYLPSLTHLKVLETPLEPLRLPLGGGSRAPLKTLTLKRCGLKALPPEFGDLDTLEEAHLQENLLKALPPTFVGLKALKRLNLDHNAFSVFPDLVARLPTLHHLSCDHNPFPEEEKERAQRLFHVTID